MSSINPKLGCDRGSWECYTPERGANCFTCPDKMPIIGSCMQAAGSVCSSYSGDTLSFPHGVNRNPPGTAPNCGMGWQACHENDGTSMGCYSCHSVDPIQGFCLESQESVCSSYGKRPAATRIDTRRRRC